MWLSAVHGADEPPAIVHRRQRQQRQKRQHRDHGDVLRQQHRKRGPPAAGLHQPLFRQGLQHNRGGGQGTGQPTASATSTVSGQRKAGHQRGRVHPICNPPSPSSRWRMSQRARGSSSSPIRNSIITTPNSAKCCRSSVSRADQPQYRANQDPGRQIAQHRPKPQARGESARRSRSGKIDRGLIKEAFHCGPFRTVCGCRRAASRSAGARLVSADPSRSGFARGPRPDGAEAPRESSRFRRADLHNRRAADNPHPPSWSRRSQFRAGC